MGVFCARSFRSQLCRTLSLPRVSATRAMALKRGHFEMSACAKKRPPEQTLKIPRAADVKVGTPVSWMPPPQAVLGRLREPSIVIGFDVETHGWPDNSCSKGHIGELGWYTMKDERTLCFARVVQIGWTIGKAELGAPAVTKTMLVKPDGFVISDRATHFHNITQERALKEGRALADALREFMDDVKEASGNDGMVVAHQIEFDFRIIYEELGRCGLFALQEDWRCVARKGYCTMNHVVGRWLQECLGQEVGPQTAKHALRLEDMLRCLYPQGEQLLAKRHDAGADAEMVRLVYIALLARARPSAGRGRIEMS